MPNVWERVRNNWPDTDELMRAGERDYDANKRQKIADAIALLWLEVLPDVAPPASVDDLNVAVQQYIANEATIMLIPVAKDAYMQGRISESKTFPEGGTVGTTGYNKLDALDALALQLAANNRRLRSLVELALRRAAASNVGSVLPHDVPVASDNTQALLDPVGRARGRGLP